MIYYTICKYIFVDRNNLLDFSGISVTHYCIFYELHYERFKTFECHNRALFMGV